MGANIAGIYGAQIFREDDKPLYNRGFSVAIAVLAAGLILAIVRWVDDYRRRRRNGNNLEAVQIEQNSPPGFKENKGISQS